MSMQEMADVCGVNVSTISNHMKKNNIPVRKRSDSLKNAYRKGTRPSGNNHHFYRRKKSDEHIENIKKAVTGRNNHRWKDGVWHNAGGYVNARKLNHPYAMKNGYVPKHRLVMERHIGRLLKKEEVVHHINENVEDNRIENLHLFKSSRDHSYFHLMERNGHSVELQYSYNLKTEKECLICRKVFRVKPSHYKVRKTCSKECGYKSQSITNKNNHQLRIT